MASQIAGVQCHGRARDGLGFREPLQAKAGVSQIRRKIAGYLVLEPTAEPRRGNLDGVWSKYSNALRDHGLL
jgi:hypothetical protein